MASQRFCGLVLEFIFFIRSKASSSTKTVSFFKCYIFFHISISRFVYFFSKKLRRDVFWHLTRSCHVWNLFYFLTFDLRWEKKKNTSRLEQLSQLQIQGDILSSLQPFLSVCDQRFSNADIGRHGFWLVVKYWESWEKVIISFNILVTKSTLCKILNW